MMASRLQCEQKISQFTDCISEDKIIYFNFHIRFKLELNGILFAYYATTYPPLVTKSFILYFIREKYVQPIFFCICYRSCLLMRRAHLAKFNCWRAQEIHIAKLVYATRQQVSYGDNNNSQNESLYVDSSRICACNIF